MNRTTIIAILAVLIAVASFLQSSSLNTRIDEFNTQLSEVRSQIEAIRRSIYPMVVKDDIDRVITIAKEPERIVSGSPSITEILFAVDAGNKVVGADSYSDYPPEFLKLKNEGKIAEVGGFATLSVEKILELKPDLVILSGLQKKFISTFEDLGVTVLLLDPKDVNDVIENIVLIGKVCGKEQNSLRLISEMTERLSNVRKAVQPSRVKVFWATWLEPIWTAGNKTFINSIIERAGGINIFANKSGYFVVSPEAVIEKQPDVIIIGLTHMEKNPESIKEHVLALPGWSNLKAIKENKLYMLKDQADFIFLRPGPRVVEAVELLARILHPEVFDVSLPNVIGDEYIKIIEIEPILAMARK